MEKKVSVIVPVYRTLEWLARCVQSITGQTYKNLEIILVDDGSPAIHADTRPPFSLCKTRIRSSLYAQSSHNAGQSSGEPSSTRIISRFL